MNGMKRTGFLLLLMLSCAISLTDCRPQDRGHATPEAAEELAYISACLPEIEVDKVLELPDMYEVLTLLSDFSANPDATRATPVSGVTMLHLACLFKKAELARCLLLDEADANAATAAGDTPLSLALSIRGVEDENLTEDDIIQLLEALISGGADIHRPVQDAMPLLSYAGLNSYHEKIFLYLLDKGCQPDETTCQAPAMMGWNTALKRMLDMGAAQRPEVKNTLLLMAAANLHKDTVQLLLDAGADVNAQHMGGTTPLLEAAGHLLSPAEEDEHEHKAAIIDVCALLIQRGADIRLAEIRQDGSPAFTAADILTKNPATVSALKESGVDITPPEITFTSGIALLEAVGKATVLEKTPPADAFDAIATVLTPTEEMRKHPSYHEVLPMAIDMLHSIDAAGTSRLVAAMPEWSGADAWTKGHADCMLPALAECEGIVLPKQILCTAAEHLNAAGKVDSAASMLELLARCPDADAEIEHYAGHSSKALVAGALAAKLLKAGLPTPRDGNVQLWLENRSREADSPVLQKAVLLTSLSRLWYGDMLPEEQEQMLAAMEEISATEAASRYRAIAAAMDDPETLDKLTEDSDSWKFELEIATGHYILSHSDAFLTPRP